MLEVRYIIATNQVTGWCGNESQFYNQDRGRPEETTTVLDIPIPPYSVNGYLLQNNQLVAIPLTDAELADEAEEKALAKADTLIDAISSLADAKVFLKRLCARLISKGSL